MSHYSMQDDDSYESEYEKIKELFNKNYDRANQKADTNVFNDLKRDLEDASNAVRMIEQEIMSIPNEQRIKQRTKIRKFKEEIEGMKKQFKDLQIFKDQSDLFGDQSRNSSEQQSGTNGTFQKISQQNQKLVDAKRVAYDVEGQTNNLGYEVHRQNEKLTGMIKTNKEISVELGLSNRLVEQIHRNIIKRKAVLYSVVSFLVLCLLIIVYNWF